MKDILSAIFIYNRFIFIFNPYGVYKDISNYIYTIRSIRKIRKECQYWEAYDLRLDWLGMPYTVLNVKDEFFEQIPKDKREFNILNYYQPLYLDLLHENLFELIGFRYTRLQNDNGVALNAYLVRFRPLFSFTHFWSTLGTSIALFLAFS